MSIRSELSSSIGPYRFKVSADTDVLVMDQLSLFGRDRGGRVRAGYCGTIFIKGTVLGNPFVNLLTIKA
jgi:hypothetical protein